MRPLSYFGAFVAIAVLASCTPDWPPASKISSLRTLGIRAEPPELAPGASAKLSTFSVDAADPERKNLTIWFACDPDASTSLSPVCASLSTFEDGSVLTNQGGLPDGVRPLWATGDAIPWREATYTAPILDLPANDPRRVDGMLAYVVAITIAYEAWRTDPSQIELAEILAKVQSGEIPSLWTLKRLPVREGDANQNPAVEGLDFGGKQIAEGVIPKLPAGRIQTVTVRASPPETYLFRDASGTMKSRDETLSMSWFTTRGEFESTRTRATERNQFNPGGAQDEPAGWLYAVIRDGRGGTNWTARRFVACDGAVLPARVLAAVPESGPAGTLVTLTGEDLSSGFEVRANGVKAADAIYAPEADAWRFTLPPGLSGPVTLEVVSRACGEDVGVGFTATGS